MLRLGAVHVLGPAALHVVDGLVGVHDGDRVGLVLRHLGHTLRDGDHGVPRYALGCVLLVGSDVGEHLRALVHKARVPPKLLA
jgi:hypothetical protein